MSKKASVSIETIKQIKARIDKILDQIIQDSRLAVALGSINALPSTEPIVYKRFNNTHAANVFLLLRAETLHLQLLALFRLWDEGEDALSIHRAVRWLRRPDVQQDIVERRKAAFLGRANQPNFTDINGYTEADREILRRNDEIDAANAAAEAKAEIQHLCQTAQQYLESDLHRSLKVQRHRVIAHSLEITAQEVRAQERGEIIAPIVVGNEQDILAITLPLVIGLNRVMRDLHVEFDGVHDLWSVYAEDYWLRFAGSPKRRRRLQDIRHRK